MFTLASLLSILLCGAVLWPFHGDRSIRLFTWADRGGGATQYFVVERAGRIWLAQTQWLARGPGLPRPSNFQPPRLMAIHRRFGFIYAATIGGAIADGPPGIREAGAPASEVVLALTVLPAFWMLRYNDRRRARLTPAA